MRTMVRRGAQRIDAFAAPGLPCAARNAGGASSGAHLIYLCTSTRWRAVTAPALFRSIEKYRPGRVTSRARLPVTS